MEIHLAGVLLALVTGVEAGSGGILYVDDDALDGGDGGAWETAYRFMQDAIAAAAGGAADEIRVAQGTYRPDRTAAAPDGTGDRSATFQMIEGVAMQGGYLGLSARPEQDPDFRDPAAYETVLSGDLLANDLIGFENNEENARHVVTSNGVGESAVLDGFTVRGGRADGFGLDRSGAGIHNETGSPTIRNCFIRTNQVFGDLGNGAGMWNGPGTQPLIQTCRFQQNFALPQLNDGGGMAGTDSSPTVLQCAFIENTAAGQGGGVFFEGGEPIIVGCDFVGNATYELGGAGLRLAFGADARVTDCQFVANCSGSSGGGARTTNSSPTFSGCYFEANEAASIGAALRGGSNGSNPPILVEDCAFVEDQFVHFANASTTLDRCTFYASGVGSDDGTLTLRGCSFLGNTTTGFGATIAAHTDTTLINCLFSGNSGRILRYGDFDVIGCTFSNNSADGDLIISNAGTVTIRNSIVWDASGIDADTLSVAYSVAFPTPPGAGNIGANPMFINAAGFDGIPGTGDDDLRLRLDSRCIDAGDNTAVPREITTDFAGDPRFHDAPGIPDTGVPDGRNPQVDMGAFEYGGADCNGNGTADGDDVFEGISVDCDENGVPDECEDCNDNDMGDACDIEEGTSEDCNQNLQPDECDIAEGTSGDVNGNGVPDECECVADVVTDGLVDVSDLLLVITQWGTAGPDADVDNDGTVGVSDLVAVILNWGPCP